MKTKNNLIIECVFFMIFAFLAGNVMYELIKEQSTNNIIWFIISHIMLIWCGYNTYKASKQYQEERLK